MRCLVVLFAALLGAACSPATVTDAKVAVMPPAGTVGANTHEASMAATKEFLLRVAAADFRAHPPAEALRFHKVRLAYLTNPEGTKRYMLCGDFSSDKDGSDDEPTPFVTIDSPGGPNGYQQMLGGNSACESTSAVFVGESDLSSSLQSRFDAL